jgi:hypothetical protein
MQSYFSRSKVRLRLAQGLAVTAVTAASALTVSGCTARVDTVRPVLTTEAEVEVETAPADVYAYPHTEYQGRTVYLVDGRWYYPHGRRWYYYRNEPPDLVRQRTYVRQAPPARRYVQPPPGEAVRVR